MKKLALSTTMILLAVSTVLAGGKVPAKKATKSTHCTSCAKAKCSSKCSSNSTCSSSTSACACK